MKNIDVDGLRGDGKGLVLYFIRAANCPVCLRHVKSLAGLGLASRGVAAAVVVPGGPAQVERVRRIAGGLAVVSSDAAGQERYRLAATLPTGSFDAAALNEAIDRL
jgi:hypothetical protein